MSDYATYAEVKAAMPDVIGSSTTTYDAILGALATRASRFIDALFGYDENAFVAPTTATDKYYSGNGLDYCYIDPCISISAVAVKESETAAAYTAWVADTDYDKATGGKDKPVWSAGYYTLLVVAPGIAKTFTQSRRTKTVKVTAKWGRTATVPDLVKQAVIEQCGRWFKRGQQAFQDVAGQAGMGELTYAQALDPDIKTLLLNSRFRRYEL